MTWKFHHHAHELYNFQLCWCVLVLHGKIETPLYIWLNDNKLKLKVIWIYTYLEVDNCNQARICQTSTEVLWRKIVHSLKDLKYCWRGKEQLWNMSAKLWCSEKGRSMQTEFVCRKEWKLTIVQTLAIGWLWPLPFTFLAQKGRFLNAYFKDEDSEIQGRKEGAEQY